MRLETKQKKREVKNMLDKTGIFSIQGLNHLKKGYLDRLVRRLYKRIYRLKNWERYTAYRKKYDREYIDSGRAIAAYWKNRDRRLATKRRWDQNNKEKRRASDKKSREKNKVKISLRNKIKRLTIKLNKLQEKK
jgi:spermidine synthase